LAALAALSRWGRIGAALLLVGLIGESVWQTRQAAFRLPADPRSPFAYVHSSPDVLKVRPLADAALARHPGDVVKVVSEEYWPLPWYLRHLANVGYWNTPPADCDAALVITSASFAAEVRPRLHGLYRESFLGLRPGFLFVVFTPDTNVP
jgi:predicted membrane-bound mannosyltransferase